MNSLCISRAKNSLWVLFFMLIACCFSGGQAYAKSDIKRGITIEDLSAIRDIKTMTLSPDGKYVAFQTMQANKDANDFKLGWYVATTTPNAKAKRVADDMEPVLREVGQFIPGEIIWSPDSQWIYFTKKYEGAIQIWRSSRSRPQQEQLTQNAGDIQSLKISSDGSKLLFTIGRTRAELENLIKEGAKQGYLQQEPSIYSPMGGPQFSLCTDGRKRYESPYQNKERACSLAVWVYDVKSGVERTATETEKKDFYDQEDNFNAWIRQGIRLDDTKQMMKLSPDGTYLAWIENEDPNVYKGYFPPMILSVSGNGKDIHCAAKACRSTKMIGFNGLWWHPNGEEVIFKVNNGPRNTLSSFYGWTPGESDVRTILSNEDRFFDCDLTGIRLICAQETWTSPKKIVSIELSDGKISTIVDVNPDFRDFNFTKIEKIFGEDDDGHLAHAHLVYPKGYKKGQPYPLVITNYRSGGFLRGAVGDEQPIHVYAQHGIAVLSFGMPELPHDKVAFSIETNAAAWHYLRIKGGPVVALEKMVDKLVKRGIIDPTRVGISGLSTGAAITDTALLRKNYAAASSAYSNSASRSPFSPVSAVGKTLDLMYGGDRFSSKGAEMRRKYSVDTNAQRIDTPMLLQVADREVETTWINYNALKAAGKPVEMYIYPDERHVKWQPAHKHMVYARNLDWFNFWLRDVEDPDPEKADQYERWRELRELHEANLAKLKAEVEEPEKEAAGN